MFYKPYIKKPQFISGLLWLTDGSPKLSYLLFLVYSTKKFLTGSNLALFIVWISPHFCDSCSQGSLLPYLSCSCLSSSSFLMALLVAFQQTLFSSLEQDKFIKFPFFWKSHLWFYMFIYFYIYINIKYGFICTYFRVICFINLICFIKWYCIASCVQGNSVFLFFHRTLSQSSTSGLNAQITLPALLAAHFPQFMTIKYFFTSLKTEWDPVKKLTEVTVSCVVTCTCSKYNINRKYSIFPCRVPPKIAVK